jgi:uncharacterized protein (DUF1501 family)
VIRRRDFLKLSGLAGVSFSMPSGLRAWVEGPPREPGSRLLVLVELTGGNDGLNTFVPHADDRYHRARPTLRIPASAVHRADDVMGFAPELAETAALFADGRLAVVQGVGMPVPDRSHFVSLDRWHAGSLEPDSRLPGWIARGLDDAGADPAMLAGVALGERGMPRILQHATRQALCCESLQDLVPPAAVRRTLSSEAVARLDAASGTPEDRRLAVLARGLMARLETLASRPIAKDAIPETHLGRMLGDALRIALGDLPVPVVFVRQGGFDTHVRQKAVQPRLLADLDGALAAFARALVSRGLAERVLVVVYSEFGRRVAENGSAGTDHGSGAPAFLLMGGVRGGIIGAPPELGDLDDGDVRATVDFRRVLAQALKHLGHAEPARVLGAGIVPLF